MCGERSEDAIYKRDPPFVQCVELTWLDVLNVWWSFWRRYLIMVASTITNSWLHERLLSSPSIVLSMCPRTSVPEAWISYDPLFLMRVSHFRLDWSACVCNPFVNAYCSSSASIPWKLFVYAIFFLVIVSHAFYQPGFETHKNITVTGTSKTLARDASRVKVKSVLSRASSAVGDRGLVSRHPTTHPCVDCRANQQTIICSTFSFSTSLR